MMDFQARVALAVDAIPEGKVALYGQLAALCGKPRHARQVGQILSRGVSGQAYKVVGAGGRLSGAAAFLVPGLQAELLRGDGVPVSEKGTVDLAQYQWQVTPDEMDALTRAWEEKGI